MYTNYIKVPNLGRRTRVYLGAPYSHANPLWMQLRFELINLAAMQLILDGFVVFSPISHSHPIASTHSDKNAVQNYDLWLGQDTHFMEWADVLVVLELPGWRDSKGLKYERDWFETHGKQIAYLHLNDVYYSELDRREANDLRGA